MDYLRGLVAACFLVSGSAHAAYAQLSPPAGWTSTPGASGNFAMGNASNAATLANGTVRTNAALNVGGRAISVPASLRFSANAPRIAAAVIFQHPAVRTAAGIATLLGLASITWDEALQAWVKPGSEYKISDGVGWWAYNISQPSKTPEAECQKITGGAYDKVMGPYDGGLTMACYKKSGTSSEFVTTMRKTSMSSCPAGWFITPAGCVQTVPPRKLSEPEFIEELAPLPMPSTVPRELPNKTPLPVERPVINPTPGDNPSPSPLFVPTGDPVPNPNYNPEAAPGPSNQPWLQPGVRVTPRPTTDSPWQVDVQPVDRPQAGPDPLPDAEQNPDTDPNDKPKEEDSKSLCEKHPDILACQKLGDITPENLAKNTVTLQINREEGFGPANGACPAPNQFVVMGKSMAFQWDLLCDFANQIRPLLVGFAYLSAALAFFGLSRKD
jgi:hypothetical protein